MTRNQELLALARRQGRPSLRTTPRRAQPEFEEQVRFFALVDLLAQLHPDRADELLDVWATSNGGLRQRGPAGKMREAGQRKGVLDIECLVPRGAFHGLVIEMKSRRGRPTPEQADRIERLSDRGYLVRVERSWQDAGRVLCDYLGVPWPRQAGVRVEFCLTRRRQARRLARRSARS